MRISAASSLELEGSQTPSSSNFYGSHSFPSVNLGSMLFRSSSSSIPQQAMSSSPGSSRPSVTLTPSKKTGLLQRIKIGLGLVPKEKLK